MISGGKANWQTIIADLALILFMVTAASLDTEPVGEEILPSTGRDAALPIEGEILALYRVDRAAPPLEEWLAAQAPDERQNLTIVAQFEQGGREAAMDGAQELASAAGAEGLRARIVLEPSDYTDLFAVLSFDGR